MVKRVVPISLVWKPHPEKPASGSICIVTWVYSNAPNAKHESVADTPSEVYRLFDRLKLLDDAEVEIAVEQADKRLAGVKEAL